MKEKALPNYKVYLLIKYLTPKSYQRFKKTVEIGLIALPEIGLMLIELAKKYNYGVEVPIKLLGKGYSDSYFRKLLSQIYKALLHYFQIENTLNTLNYKDLIAHFYEQQQLELVQLLQREYKQKLSIIDTPEEHLKRYYHKKQQLLWFDSKTHQRENTLQESRNALEIFYTIEKLQLLIIEKSHHKLYGANQSVSSLEVLNGVSSELMGASPVLKLLVQVYTLLCTDDELLFQKIVEEQELQHLLTPELQKTAYLSLLNYCIQKINTKQDAYLSTTFQLYQKGWEQGWLLDQGQLSPFAFSNTITIGLKLQEYNWIETYIEQASLHLPLEVQASYKVFNQAKLYYEQKAYKSSKKALFQIDFEEEVMNLNAKTILLKIYYEEADFESLDYLLDSFKSYIQRKKTQGFYKDYFSKLVRYAKKLISITRTKDYKKLLLEVESTPQMAAKDWLIQKIKMALKTS